MPAPQADLNDPTRLAVAFTRTLRGVGMAIPMSSTIAYAEALAVLGCDARDNTYWAGRATLTHSPAEIEVYDRAFAVFWDGAGANLVEEAPPETITVAVDTGDDDTDPDDPNSARTSEDENVLELRFSTTEILRTKDFADFSEDELREASALMRQMRFVGTPRRSLRSIPARRNGKWHDLRRTVRSAMTTSGETIELRSRRPGVRPRRVVMLVDVSGSMEPYARALIRFAHATVTARQKVEVFALGTRLTRLTRQLDAKDPDQALKRATAAVVDYGGGTRLGEGLQRFNDEWGQRGMARGAIVIVLSDGWDRGRPELLGEQMARLRRIAHQIIWVNPLKVTPGYAPLARGMSAALPYLDRFIEGHSLEAIETLAQMVTQATSEESDPRGRATPEIRGPSSAR